MTNKKITILYVLWGVSYGGSERFILNVVRHLDKKKYNVVVFSDSQSKGELQKDFEKYGAKVIYSGYSRFRHPVKFIHQIRDIIDKEGIDLIHANDDLNMVFSLIANGEKAKFVAHSHNTHFTFTSNRIVSFVASKILPYYISKKADVRLGCGHDAGKALFRNRKFTVVYNGLDVDPYKFSNKVRNELRKQYLINDASTVILNIGRLDKQKNQTFLIDVFYEYQKQNTNSLLLIIGDGPKKVELARVIEGYGLNKKVILLNGCSDAYKYYNMADLFVMTSLYEGMPMVSIEAQLNGLRCIFSDAISRESDHSGRTVFLPLESGCKKWADRVMMIKTDREKCNYGSVRKYDIKNVVADLDNIYKKIVEGKSI